MLHASKTLGLLFGFSFLSAQHVGIGIATPSARLEVYDHDPASTIVGGRVRISADGGGGRRTYLEFSP